MVYPGILGKFHRWALLDSNAGSHRTCKKYRFLFSVQSGREKRNRYSTHPYIPG
jgi:hypothetical protein